MLRKLFLGTAIAVTALLMSDTASAGHGCGYGGYGGHGGYGGYGGGVAVYRAPVVVGHGYRGHSPYHSGYRGYGYGVPRRSYSSPYRSFYGGGYGYGGSYFGGRRGGISIGIGF